MSDSQGRQWIKDGAKRRSRREAIAGLIFGTLLGVLFAVGGLSKEELGAGGPLLFGAAGFLLGWYLVGRRKREPIPDYVREFASRHRFNLSNDELAASTPLLQQPFCRTHGVAWEGSGDSASVSVAPFDYVRASRWHLEMFVRVLFRIWGEPKSVKLVVAATEIPEVARLAPVVLSERRFGPGFLDSIDDAVRRLRHLRHESAKLDESHEIFVLPEQDDVWPRRLFSPSFLHWQANEGADISWELVAGRLVVATTRRSNTTEELDRCFDALRFIDERIREEVGQSDLALSRS